MSRMPKSFAKGRYTVLEKIGEGFTSAVYLVLDEAVDSKVALKIANPRTSADTNLVKRFEQEIYILERFQHRNLVKHMNHGFERGRPFLVMEYVEGLSLNNWLKSHRETVEIIEILIQLLQALKYVHSKGVVHRDMKPSNVIIIETFNGNHLKIIDFGFARWLDGNEHITMTGEIVGSPAYMAPEQIRSSVTVDHRCDIFTFGIIAFEAFAGVLPFAGDSPSETAYKIFSEPPSSLLEIRSDLPDALINLIEKCLDKQVYQRPPNADAFIDELSMIKEKLL